MSAIPIHVQRRFEGRWASRFAVSVGNRVGERRDESHNIKINRPPRRAAKTEEKSAEVKVKRSAAV
jgi:hypothetical protein